MKSRSPRWVRLLASSCSVLADTIIDFKTHRNPRAARSARTSTGLTSRPSGSSTTPFSPTARLPHLHPPRRRKNSSLLHFLHPKCRHRRRLAHPLRSTLPSQWLQSTSAGSSTTARPCSTRTSFPRIAETTRTRFPTLYSLSLPRPPIPGHIRQRRRAGGGRPTRSSRIRTRTLRWTCRAEMKRDRSLLISLSESRPLELRGCRQISATRLPMACFKSFNDDQNQGSEEKVQ